MKVLTVYTKNFKIIENRWSDIGRDIKTSSSTQNVSLTHNTPQPTLFIDDIHLSSGYNQVYEAEIQACLIPEKSSQACVYGVGSGQLPRVLLHRPELERLTVVIMNPSVAMESFEHFDHSDWLSDSRVNLVLAKNESEIRIPFAAIPSCLELASDDAARLRDCIFLELSTPFIRDLFTSKNAELSQRIRQNMGFISSDEDVAQLFNKNTGKTFIVAGAGPTLSHHYEFIQKWQKDYPLIAVDAALQAFVAAGITPDIVVTVDASELVMDFFEAVDPSKLRGKVLVYFPVVHKSILTHWPGKRYVAYSIHPLYSSFQKEHPRGTLFASGSVLHPSVDLAVKMGASKVLFFGADFSFPGGKSHVNGCPRDRISNIRSVKKHWVTNGLGERVVTTPDMRGFLRDLERYIQHHPEIQFFNGSKEGAHIKGTTYIEESHL